ncbi:phosphotransferase [Variovorax paradoxus]|nr:phosphotransferase [Variovorax paradoxus]
MTQPRRALIAQTTPTGDAIAQAVAQGYALGEVLDCALLRRGFNHVYGLRFAEGRRAVARLSAERPRGAPNTDYEAALLAHLKAAGAGVAATLPPRDGAAAIAMHLPEGARTLMLFEHLDGEPPDEALPDIQATGRGLALLHEAGQDYSGPASRYVLELPHLLGESLQRLCTAPTMDDALRTSFTAIARRLNARIAAMPALTRVNCHGDCHGSNNFMTDGPEGTRIASFFDFDDAGPGWLAYELCVYLWAMLPRTAGRELDAAARERWRRYIAGYRGVRPIGAADFDAIAPFLAVRQFWLMGEYAGRIAVWGTQAMPTSWLRKQVELLTAWESLKTPD